MTPQAASSMRCAVNTPELSFLSNILNAYLPLVFQCEAGLPQQVSRMNQRAGFVNSPRFQLFIDQEGGAETSPCDPAARLLQEDHPTFPVLPGLWTHRNPYPSLSFWVPEHCSFSLFRLKPPFSPFHLEPVFWNPIPC